MRGQDKIICFYPKSEKSMTEKTAYECMPRYVIRRNPDEGQKLRIRVNIFEKNQSQSCEPLELCKCYTPCVTCKACLLCKKACRKTDLCYSCKTCKIVEPKTQNLIKLLTEKKKPCILCINGKPCKICKPCEEKQQDVNQNDAKDKPAIYKCRYVPLRDLNKYAKPEKNLTRFDDHLTDSDYPSERELTPEIRYITERVPSDYPTNQLYSQKPIGKPSSGKYEGSSRGPSGEPSGIPSDEPFGEQSGGASGGPSGRGPSKGPSGGPSVGPSSRGPSKGPSGGPSGGPSSRGPSKGPSGGPSSKKSGYPSDYLSKHSTIDSDGPSSLPSKNVSDRGSSKVSTQPASKRPISEFIPDESLRSSSNPPGRNVSRTIEQLPGSSKPSSNQKPSDLFSPSSSNQSTGPELNKVSGSGPGDVNFSGKGNPSSRAKSGPLSIPGRSQSSRPGPSGKPSLAPGKSGIGSGLRGPSGKPSLAPGKSGIGSGLRGPSGKPSLASGKSGKGPELKESSKGTGKSEFIPSLNELPPDSYLESPSKKISELPGFESNKPLRSDKQLSSPFGSPLDAGKPFGSPLDVGKPFGSPFGSSLNAGKPFGSGKPLVAPLDAGKPFGSPLDASKPFGSPLDAGKPFGSPFGSPLDAGKPFDSPFEFGPKNPCAASSFGKPELSGFGNQLGKSPQSMTKLCDSLDKPGLSNAKYPGFGDDFGKPGECKPTQLPGFGDDFGKTVAPQATSSMPLFGECSSNVPLACSFPSAAKSCCPFRKNPVCARSSFPSYFWPKSNLSCFRSPLELQSTALLACPPLFGTSIGYGLNTGTAIGFSSFNGASSYGGSLYSTVAPTNLALNNLVATTSNASCTVPPKSVTEPIECTTICGKKSQIDAIKQQVKGSNLVNF